MDSSNPLPEGHLLNLQPRPRIPKLAKLDTGDLGCARNQKIATGTRQVKMDSAIRSPKTTPDTTPRKVTPTRLPLPKSFIDKAKDPQGDNTTESGPRNQPLGRHFPLKASPMSLERRPAKTTEKDREQYWRKVKDKFDKESPISSKVKEKQREYYHDAYRKIVSLASSPKQEISRHKQKYVGTGNRDEKTTVRDANPKITIVHPHFNTRNDDDHAPRSQLTDQKQSRLDRDQQERFDVSDTRTQGSSEKTDNTTGSSIRSYPSISPVSGPSSSITEWEDKFVVNMPSAREPNPPTMSAHQIAQFQHSIDKVHKEGETMLDPETLPSPRTTTPEDKPNPPEHDEKKTGTLDGQDSQLATTNEVNELASSTPTGTGRRYYCPDEVGKQRFSTIWEESPARQKWKIPPVNPDGSFLGCKEINGPNDKNPDEILLFSTTDERPRVVDVSSPISKTPRERRNTATRQVTPPREEKNAVQEEWKPISQNLKQVQCSKQLPKLPTTMCRETQCQPPERAEMPTKISGKENSAMTGSSISLPEKERKRNHPRADDVFIVTPTITRTMMTMADMRGAAPKPSGKQEPTSRAAGEIITDARTKAPVGSTPSGLRRATQNSWEKSTAQSTTSSKPNPTTNTSIPIVKPRVEPQNTKIERPYAIRGYIRTPGMVKSPTENLGQRIRTNQHSRAPSSTPSSGNTSQGRSVSDSSQFAKSTSVQNLSVITSFTGDNRMPKRTVQSARIFEVAELDGHQVGDFKDDPHKEEVPPLPKPIDPIDKIHDTEVQVVNKDVMNPVTFSLIMDILILSIAQAQELYTQIMANRNSRAVLLKITLNCVLKMVEHCLYVFKCFLTACSVYNTTGAWPKSSDQDLARSLTELGQAMIYLVALGFLMMIVGRAAGYVVLIGSWVVWVTKPFGWVLGTIGRALLT